MKSVSVIFVCHRNVALFVLNFFCFWNLIITSLVLEFMPYVWLCSPSAVSHHWCLFISWGTLTLFTPFSPHILFYHLSQSQKTLLFTAGVYTSDCDFLCFRIKWAILTTTNDFDRHLLNRCSPSWQAHTRLLWTTPFVPQSVLGPLSVLARSLRLGTSLGRTGPTILDVAKALLAGLRPFIPGRS